jgi:hypothetical protein
MQSMAASNPERILRMQLERSMKRSRKSRRFAMRINVQVSNACIGMVAAPGKTPMTVKYPYRSGCSVLQQFQKKISPDVMKWMGVLELSSDGEPKFKSGEDYAHWINQMLEIFHTKEGKTFEFCECWGMAQGSAQVCSSES